MVAVRQTSFAGGELAPNLYGRPDLAKYAVGLARCFNLFISRQGQAVSRAGTEYVGQTKLSNAIPPVAQSPARLIPFVYSDELAYVLEFGDGYVRVWKDGARVGTVEVSTPYAYADLVHLKYAQSGSVLELTCLGYPPASLTRVSETSWTYSAMSFGRPTFGRTATIDDANYIVQTSDASHPKAEWQWCVTRITRNIVTGLVSESTPYIIAHLGTSYSIFTGAMPSSIVVYPDRPQIVNLPGAVDGVGDLAWRVYRGRGSTWGWVGDTTSSTFTDLGDAPDFTIQPPRGVNPLQVLNSDGSLASTETPASVAFFEDRLVFGGTDGRPTTVLGSTTSDYYNFDSRLYPVENEALNFTLAARKREQIRSIVPLTKLLCFTDAAVWSIGGSGGAALSFDSVDAKVQVEVGANWVDPAVIDGVALFARTKGTGLRALGFDFTKQAFSGQDMSILASHLTEDNQIVAMAFCEDPWSVLWVLRDDGVLLSFTFIKDQDVWAWAQHTISGGTVKSICSIPENGEDVLYVVVDRGFGLFSETYTLERMKSRKLKLDENEDGTYASQPWCLDCAIQTSHGAPTPGTIAWKGQQVMALGDGVVYGPFTTSYGAITSTIPDDLAAASNVIWGLAYDAELETLDPIVPGAETRLQQKTVKRILVETQDSFGFMAGPDFDSLLEYPGRRLSDGYGPEGQRSEAATLWLQKAWGPKGHVCIRQSNPLPLTVLGITRDLVLGDP